LHIMKAYGRSRVVPPLILNLDTGYRKLVKFPHTRSISRERAHVTYLM